MKLPVLTNEWVERLEQSEIGYMVSRMNAIREREGNPEGVEMASFGGATAFYSRTMPWPQFNTVKGITSQEIGRLDDILAFYRERDRACQFEIVPGRVDGHLLESLAARGFYQRSFHSTMYGLTEEKLENQSEGLPVQELRKEIGAGTDFEEGLEEESGGISIRKLRSDEFLLYGELHCLGTGLSADGAPYVAENNRVLYGRPGWSFFIGQVDGIPAGVGVMYAQGNIASLTFAATLPDYRRRGLQSALILRRMREARQLGCYLVVGQAAYASSSQNNMERAGMRLAYSRATWVKR
ncbi:N-acetyltransferase [Paenibacillus sp. J2TS4]|nr:N-acetyltransferase [Paenibacillus sp. J2TS4]